MTKRKLAKLLYKHFYKPNRNCIDLSNLDFTEYNCDVSLNHLKVKGDLCMSDKVVDGDLYQRNNRVGKNLYQSHNIVGKSLRQNGNRVKENIHQNGQEFGQRLYTQDTSKLFCEEEKILGIEVQYYVKDRPQDKEKDKHYLMKCGHVVNSRCNGKPYCVICNCDEVVKKVENTKGLENRKAICPNCGKIVNSKWDLPFFKHRPDKEFDEYYDGCHGWG